MHGPGESLRQEREARGKTIEEMVEATGIRLPLLTALEQEAFDSLPGRGFGKLYIRAYAEVLGFDPRPVIEAYDRAVPGRQDEASTAVPASAPRPIKAALTRWRQERMARRAEADLSEEPEEETFDQLEGMEQDPEEAAEAEPGPVAVEQEAAPEYMEEPTVQTVPRPADPAEELVKEGPPRPLPMEALPPSRPARSRWWLVAALLILIPLPLVAYLGVLRTPPGPPPAAARRQPVPAQVIAPPPSLPPPPEAAETSGAPPRAQTPVREPTASFLKVAESGVGLRLSGTRLEGEGDHFRSGQRVTFAMRVLGGGVGESIRHVWLRDGKVEQSIRLRLGGPSWRTHSTKTLGRPGVWAVEARDEQGRVLARADLTVAP